MFLFKNKTLSSLINSFKLWEDTTKKYNQIETDAFVNLENWSAESNNVAIQDVSSKLMVLYTKLNNDTELDKTSAINEMMELFKRFKEYEMKLNKLKEKIADLEKLEKKREKELDKCPQNKNIRDYEVRLYQTKSEKEKLELEYYGLCNEVEATKIILFKTNFTKFYDSLLKRNKAEQIVLNAMNNLMNELPDITSIEIKDVHYGNYDQTNEILNNAMYNLNNLKLTADPETMIKQARTQLKPRKKLKTRISCPHITSNLYPSLEAVNRSFNTMQRSNSIAYKVMPSAPPLSDVEGATQKKI